MTEDGRNVDTATQVNLPSQEKQTIGNTATVNGAFDVNEKIFEAQQHKSMQEALENQLHRRITQKNFKKIIKDTIKNQQEQELKQKNQEAGGS